MNYTADFTLPGELRRPPLRIAVHVREAGQPAPIADFCAPRGIMPPSGPVIGATSKTTFAAPKGFLT